MVVTLLHTGTQFTVVTTLCITCTSCKKNLVRINRPPKTPSVRNSGCVTDNGDHGWWERSACHWTYLMLTCGCAVPFLFMCTVMQCSVLLFTITGLSRRVVSVTVASSFIQTASLTQVVVMLAVRSHTAARVDWVRHRQPYLSSFNLSAVSSSLRQLWSLMFYAITIWMSLPELNGPRFVCMYVSFGQGSSLLWTHTLRPLYSRPIALTQEGRSQVDDVCECMCDWRVRRGE